MTPALETEFFERIATALECQANYQQRALAFSERIAAASERMCLIAEYQLNDRLNNNEN